MNTWARVASANPVAMPTSATSHIQKMAPGHPAEQAELHEPCADRVVQAHGQQDIYEDIRIEEMADWVDIVCLYEAHRGPRAIMTNCRDELYGGTMAEFEAPDPSGGVLRLLHDRLAALTNGEVAT